MKGGETDERWKTKRQRGEEAYNRPTERHVFTVHGSRVEQKSSEPQRDHNRAVLCVTGTNKKNTIYRSHEHVGLKVLSCLKTKHHTTWDDKTTSGLLLIIQIHMSNNFTVIFKRYILIIIITLMRKYYTLVKNGRQEVEAELETRKCLLYCLRIHITIDFLPHSRKIIIFSHLLLLSRSCPVTVWVSLKCFTCIAVFTDFNI